MKKGVIVYITGIEPESLSKTPIDMLKDLEISADQIEFVSSHSGHFDIHNATWKLIVSGMQHILCMSAAYSDESSLILTGQSMKLCG